MNKQKDTRYTGRYPDKKDWVSAENNGFIVFCGQTERFITKHQRKYI